MDKLTIINQKSKKLLVWVESALITALLLGFLYFACGVYFETIDDRAINDIFSGVITGKPDGHAIFVNYLLGAGMAFLYSLNVKVAWYGLFLILCHYAVYVCFIGILLEQSNSFAQHVGAILCGCFLIGSNMYIFGEIQYTSTAAVLAAGGYFCFFFDKDSKKIRKYLLFFIFELLALLLRVHAMLMIQIVGLSIISISLLTTWLKKDISLKKLCTQMCGIGCIISSCLLIGWIGNYVVGDYSEEEWQTYTYYRQLRGDMGDYYGFPEYKEVAHIFETSNEGFTENEYLAFCRYWILGNEIDIACLEQIHDVARTNYMSNQGPFISVLKELLTSRFQYGIMGYGKYTLILYAIIVFICIFSKMWSMLISLMGLNVGRNIALGYLIYYGRVPFRVLSGLYVVELIFLVACLYFSLKEHRLKKIIHRMTICVVVLAVTISSATMCGVFNSLKSNHITKEFFSKGMDDIIHYCSQKEAGYLLVEIATAYYMGEALSTDWNVERNFLSSGLWWSTSPHITAYQQNYLNENRDNLYLIEMGDGLDPGQSYVLELFTVDWGRELIFVENLQLSNGIVLEVYNIK